MLMCKQNFVKFCQFVLKMLNGNKILTSIKGQISAKFCEKMLGNNPKLDLVSDDVIQNLVRFCLLVLKILIGNKILMSNKGCNSRKILRKMTSNNPKLNLINVYGYVHLCLLMFTESQNHGMTG